MDFAKSGADALAAGDPATAVTQYTKALLVHPASPDYLTQRATAFARLRPARYDLALRDSELAVLCGRKRSSRKHIQAAQLRRVVGLYHNGRYAEAKYVLGTMQKWLPREAEGEEKLQSAMSGGDQKASMEVKIWQSKVTKRLAENPQPEFSSKDEYPEGTDKDVADAALLKLYKSQLKPDGTFDFNWQPGQDSSAASTTAWYQNNQSVILTLYAKGVPKDKAQIEIQADSVSISFPQPSDPAATFSFAIDPLHALIDASSSTAKIMSTKVELTLKKASPDDTTTSASTTPSSDPDPVAKAAVLSSLQHNAQPQPQTAGAPVYPTSSKSGPKNWDKLAKDLTRKKTKQHFQESNGTALSTNWAEVASKRYDPVEEDKKD
ncbi:hypothetical protein DV735_g4212, partial [Chaetothyriales sp. CBS 134920]